ncbi:MAG: hypothetical protein VKL20_07755 [Synechocystis sp.]|nr:hypothetical protein [Synechocystis sp.]
MSAGISILWICAGNTPAKADYVHQTMAERSGTIAEWRIEEKQVKLILEIDEVDKPIFSYLKPGKPETQLLRGNQQQVLPGKITVLEPRQRVWRFDPNSPPPMDLRGITTQLRQPSETVTYAEIVYPLGQKPGQLTLVPPLAEDGKTAQTNVGFITFQDEVPITNYWYLSRPETLKLDWQDPWYSAFENRNLKRPHQSSVTSYLYVEPYEVRHEIIIRVQDLAPFLGLEINRETQLNPEDLQDIREKAIQFFRQTPVTTIDGKPVSPLIDQSQFLAVDSRGVFQVLPENQPQKAVAAIFGITLAYPTAGIPQEVQVTWNLFNDRIQTIASQVTDPAGNMPYFVTPQDNVVVWQNLLKTYELPEVEYLSAQNRVKLPVGLLLGLAGAIVSGVWFYRQRQEGNVKTLYYGLPIGCLLVGLVSAPFTQVAIAGTGLMLKPVSNGEAQVIFDHLLRNIYRAMDFQDENTIYDKLAISLDGELLTEMYLQNQQSQALENEGGAIAKVNDVKILSVERDKNSDQDGQMAFKTQWTTTGTVQHWGHSHNRQNQYEAILSIAPVDQAWKIINIDFLSESRVQ